MYIQLTTRCNMRCAHCCFACTESGEDMSMETFGNAIRLVQDTESYCTLGGGEPTVHPKFELMLFRAMAATAGSDGGVFVVTNGKDARIAVILARLARAGMIGAALSRDRWHEGVDPEVYEAFDVPPRTRVVARWPVDPEDRERRELRETKPEHLVRSGRSRTGARECCCDGPFVKPNGDVAVCGCAGSPVLGNVNENFHIEDHDVFEECGRWAPGGKLRDHLKGKESNGPRAQRE